jgi:biopolymer transport protein ExbB/TolQ
MVGVMDSLVVAAAGLAVSIVTTVMYGSLRTRLERTTLELEAAASQIVGYVMSRKNREDAK